jgi:hypothetical protein
LRFDTTPNEWERRFTESLNLEAIQKALWPLLAVFILLSFWDTITTFYAAVLEPGSFVEFNPLGAALFKLGFAGFMLAYVLKFVPIIPLFYMVAFKREGKEHDFQVRVIKYAAFVVLLSLDIFIGAIVFGNNLPQLVKTVSR